MIPKMYHCASAAIDAAGYALRNTGIRVDADRWQGMEAPAPMLELFGPSFRCPIRPTQIEWAEDVRPNLPWADEHFAERVSGIPSNPGTSYVNWPFYPTGTDRDAMIRKAEQFTHTYQERFWPKRAGQPSNPPPGTREHRGIRYGYGDLKDVVRLLDREPQTRQAYLPVWFPEDTGACHGGRVPCTLGYQFLYRRRYMHCLYGIRSCDYFRHFRDDIYLAGRLVQWVIDQLGWDHAAPGTLTMTIGSLHCWYNERGVLPKGV